MGGCVSTAENIAIAIWDRLKTPIADSGAQLHCVKVQETENNAVEYFGGDE
ncbi:MAG: 6-pyruvoyl tetrahydropterin synthase family protein [Flavobacteriales bacterium]